MCMISWPWCAQGYLQWHEKAASERITCRLLGSGTHRWFLTTPGQHPIDIRLKFFEGTPGVDFIQCFNSTMG